MNRKFWLNKVNFWKNKWQYKKEQFSDSVGIDLYFFILTLSELLSEDSCVVATAGSSYYSTCQALRLKKNSRHIVTSSAEMGCGPSLAIGCSFARNKKDVILIEGDGSINCSLDELSSIVSNQLPIKIFVFSNNGYLSIRNTMKNMFENRVFGTDNSNGLFLPPLEKIAGSYGIKYLSYNKHKGLDNIIKEVLEFKGPIIVDLKCNPNQIIHPGAGFTRDKDGKIIPLGLDRMSPQLSNEEFESERYD